MSEYNEGISKRLTLLSGFSNFLLLTLHFCKLVAIASALAFPSNVSLCFRILRRMSTLN